MSSSLYCGSLLVVIAGADFSELALVEASDFLIYSFVEVEFDLWNDGVVEAIENISLAVLDKGIVLVLVTVPEAYIWTALFEDSPSLYSLAYKSAVEEEIFREICESDVYALETLGKSDQT